MIMPPAVWLCCLFEQMACDNAWKGLPKWQPAFCFATENSVILILGGHSLTSLFDLQQMGRFWSASEYSWVVTLPSGERIWTKSSSCICATGGMTDAKMNFQYFNISIKRTQLLASVVWQTAIQCKDYFLQHGDYRCKKHFDPAYTLNRPLARGGGCSAAVAAAAVLLAEVAQTARPTVPTVVCSTRRPIR